MKVPIKSLKKRSMTKCLYRSSLSFKLFLCHESQVLNFFILLQVLRAKFKTEMTNETDELVSLYKGMDLMQI